MSEQSEVITSTHNRQVQLCRSLRRTKTRREAGAYLVEGVRLGREALMAGVELVAALYDPDALSKSALEIEVLTRLETLNAAYAASPAAIAAASETQTPQGLVLAVRQPQPLDLSSLQIQLLLLILDGIADAGNAGTIMRSAAAAGLSAVVFAGQAVDPWNGKAVRAGMGAHFRLQIVEARWDEIISAASDYDQVVAAEADAAGTVYDVDWSSPTILILGSEAHGLSTESQALTPKPIRIPMAPGVESLNAAVAASIILFHARRESGR